MIWRNAISSSNKRGTLGSTRKRRQHSSGWKSTIEFLTHSKRRKLARFVASAVSADKGSQRLCVSNGAEDSAHYTTLRLDQRRRDVFGNAGIDATAQFAVPHAVQKINHQPDSQPDDKPNPGHYRQTQHQNKAQQHAEEWKDRHERHAKRTRPFRRDAAQHVYA